jgi:hypothetical protein
MPEAWRRNPHASVTPSERNADDPCVGLLRAHLAAVAVVVFAVAAVGAFFTFARPAYHPDVVPSPPNDLPYSHVAYHTAQTQVAFASGGVHLTMRSQLPAMDDLSTNDLRVEVTVFGSPGAVRSSGSFDYVLDANRRWVHYPRTCSGGVRSAALWQENVRAIVRCGAGDTILLRRVHRALAALPRT